MELGKQIKKYRNELSISQEALADRIFVSRQTISNWENDKNYPDINSLVLLSEVFDTSIDNLIKGDVKMMKEQINYEDKRKFEKLSQLFGGLFLLMVVSLIPLVHFLNYAGIVIWFLLVTVTMYVAILVEKQKKKFDIQTYREIVAFTEGKGLDEITKAREEGKRPYQKILLAFGAGIITLLIAVVFMLIFR